MSILKPLAKLNSYSAATTAVKLCNTDAARQEVIIQNDSGSVLYIGLTQEPTSSVFSAKLQPYDSFFSDWRGPIFGVWDAAQGQARVTEEYYVK